MYFHFLSYIWSALFFFITSFSLFFQSFSFSFTFPYILTTNFSVMNTSRNPPLKVTPLCLVTFRTTFIFTPTTLITICKTKAMEELVRLYIQITLWPTSTKHEVVPWPSHSATVITYLCTAWRLWNLPLPIIGWLPHTELLYTTSTA